MQNNFSRDSLLISLGGGMVGDVAGYAAACYQRGMKFMQIPTTLLAQVDSALGGKVAINFENNKNLLGAFYNPESVIIDIATLKSLPQLEYISGLAEIVKYGLICDAEFFAWLETNWQQLLAKDCQSLLFAIEKSICIKSTIVKQDPHDLLDIRALLNLGHTFGHALEMHNQYQLLHGLAVARGILIAARLSTELGLLANNDYNRIKKLLVNFQLLQPIDIPTSDEFIKLLYRDKKIKQGKLSLILLRGIGEAFVTRELDSGKIKSYLKKYEVDKIISTS